MCIIIVIIINIIIIIIIIIIISIISIITISIMMMHGARARAVGRAVCMFISPFYVNNTIIYN